MLLLKFIWGLFDLAGIVFAVCLLLWLAKIAFTAIFLVFALIICSLFGALMLK